MASGENGNVGSADLAVIALELLAGPVAVLVCRADWHDRLGQCVGDRTARRRPSCSSRCRTSWTSSRTRLSDPAAGRALRQFRRPGGKDPFWAFTKSARPSPAMSCRSSKPTTMCASTRRWPIRKALFRHAIEAAEHGVWDYNANNEALFYSDAWKTMRGFPLDGEFHDSNALWEARLHPDDLESVREHLQAIQQRRDRTLQLRVSRAARGRPLDLDPGPRPRSSSGMRTGGRRA